MNTITDKLAYLTPEIILLFGATLCLFVGMARTAGTRKLTPWIAGIALVLCVTVPRLLFGADLGATPLASYVKGAVAVVGVLLLLVAAQTPGALRQSQEAERAATFEPGDVIRGEFFAFFLLSLTGVMLCAGAGDLVWLFLALELTSLPTYVMVATARDKAQAQESAVKYFFLGAMAAAVFLYGFALIYGATGSTNFHDIQASIVATGQPTHLLLAGLVLAVIGICFKIAAVPMHFYAADVYQGAATSVTAFLAFVPKMAGFVSLILLLNLVIAATGELPLVLSSLLAVIAVATMTVGNVLGLLQTSVKRVLAYSSIAHSGYMLVGLLAIAGSLQSGEHLGSGVAAVLFYLVAYGLSTLAAFAVLGCLQRNGDEADSYDDISGLVRQHPVLASVMLLSVLSLVGLPPMVGFLGKIYLFGSAFDAGYGWIVVIGVLNAAIGAVYYLRIAATCFFGDPVGEVQSVPAAGRRIGAAVAAVASLVLGTGAGSRLVDTAAAAGQTERYLAPQNEQIVETPAAKPVAQDTTESHNRPG